MTHGVGRSRAYPPRWQLPSCHVFHGPVFLLFPLSVAPKASVDAVDECGGGGDQVDKDAAKILPSSASGI